MEDPKGNREKEYCDFFVRWFEEKYGLVFDVLPKENDSSIADAFIVDSVTSEKIPVQVVRSNPDSIKNALHYSRLFEQGDIPFMRGVSYYDYIEKSLLLKKDHYSIYDKAKTILLLEGHPPTPRNESDISKLEFPEELLGFRGIYYVLFPVLSSRANVITENGCVVTIKSFIS